MQVILSERILQQTIRDLEDLGEATNDEMMVLFDQYRNRLLEQLKNYGLHFGGMVEQVGTVASYEFALSRDVPRETIIQGLMLIRPVCVTVNIGDIPALVQNPVFAGAFQSGWSSVAYDLERIQPSEILDKIESLAGRFLGGEENVETQLTYDQWALSNGIPNLPTNYEKAARFRQQEEEAYQKAQQERFDNWGRDQESSSWGVREIE